MRAKSMLTVAVMLFGCGRAEHPVLSGEGPDITANDDVLIEGRTNPVALRDFVFTITADRKLFVEEDIHYRGAAGPYAIYEVTGAHPHLSGPLVHVDASATSLWSSICATGHFFAPEGDGPRTTVSLHVGENTWVENEMPSTSAGHCTVPTDRYGTHVRTPAEGGAERLEVNFAPPPPAGSVLLLRALMFDEQGFHSMSHGVPGVCCNGAECAVN